MRNKFELHDYEPVTPSRQRERFQRPKAAGEAPQMRSAESTAEKDPETTSREDSAIPNETLLLKRGHSLTFLGLFLFTFLLYFRPYELIPSLSFLSKSALVVAIVTLALFVPTQLGLENRITAKLREVKLASALLVTGLLSIPLALEPARAWQSLVEFFKVVVVFIMLVNVLRTEKRLRWLLLLVLSASCVVSFVALSDYATGNLVLQGKRIAGFIGGMFSNPNDLALHLVTMIPISFALFLGARGPLNKTLYLVCSLLLIAGLVATFSRGGFLGFVFVIAFLGWKLARRNRVIFGAIALVLVVGAVAFAPSAYRSRISTTDDESATARTDDLKRSILVAARHPLFGVGMDNYILYSNLNKATHNAYTQVAAEMGLAALLIYVWFLVSPFNGLRRLEQSTKSSRRKPAAYYLAVGLQASLIGYAVVSFFASVAFLWYVYYLVAYAVCLQRIHASALVNSKPTLKLTTAPVRRDSSLGFDGSVVVGGN